jgi:hypothetical protein
MSDDHNIDRRYNDLSFKVDITKQITELKAELTANTSEIKEIKVDLKQFHDRMDQALNGSLMTPGLMGQAYENARQVQSLKKHIFRGLPFILLVVFFFGEQVNPIINDWLYQKTHLKIFASAAESFKEKKSTKKVTVRHIHITRKVNAQGEVVEEVPGRPAAGD